MDLRLFGAYAVGPNGLDSGEVQPPVVPWGAGLWMPKKFLDQVWPNKRESKLADRTGNALSSGGDTELCYWAKELGYKWYFLKEMTFDHLVPKKRMNKNYLRELYYCFGEAEARINHFYGEVDDNGVKFSKVDQIKEKFYLQFLRLIDKGELFGAELNRRRKLGWYLESLKLNEDPTH